MSLRIDKKLTYIHKNSHSAYKISDVNKELGVIWMKANGFGIAIPYRLFHFNESFSISLKNKLSKL